MRRTLIAPPVAVLAAGGLLLAPALGTGASSKTYPAKLKASNEVPKADSRATGTASFKVARDGRSISFRITGTRLEGAPQAAHLHLGRPGQNGPVLLLLEGSPFTLPTSGKVTAANFTPAGGVTSFAEAVTALKKGRLYVNVHTDEFPGGELRGQVKAPPKKRSAR